MIKSMTGYGRCRFEGEALVGVVEVKSVNHRFLDSHIKLPSELAHLEQKVRRIVQAKVRRGRVDLFVNIEKNDAIEFSFNKSLVNAYMKALEQVTRDFAISGQVDLVQLLRTPGILNVECLKVADGDLLQLEEGILNAVQGALDQLDQMRHAEGNALTSEILKRLDLIESEVARIKDYTQGALFVLQERLRSRISDLLSSAQIDPGRLAQEAAFYVERSDITEEIARLESHCEQCRSYLASGVEVGKTLDFILQEMNREANTVLSKTTGMSGNGLDIANGAILIKTEIEKIREQIQNLE